MFESLSNRLQDVFRSIRGEGRLTEETVELALREIRMALLEADVNFKVVKAFIDRVRDRAVDQEVLRSLTPDQQVVRIVRDEMLALFGDAQGGLTRRSETPARRHAARPPGLGQDDDVGEAREVADEAGTASAARLDRRAAPGGDRAAVGRRETGRRARARSGRRDGSGQARRGRADRGEEQRLRRRHRRHGGPAAHRRRVDGRAAGDQGRGAARSICCSSPTR